MPKQDPHIDAAYTVRAGKFRRYHGEGIRQVFDIKTVLKNARDLVYVVIGFFQSWRLLRHIKPDCVFIKGGFVGVPVGLAAASLHIPYVTHDSDALPGLANRIIAPWAARHAVALPKDIYRYPIDKTITVGVPVHANYQRVTPELQRAFRQAIGLSANQKILLVTGGGLGADRLNKAIAAIAPALLTRYPDLTIVHTVGRAHEAAMRRRYVELLDASNVPRVIIAGYLTDLYRYSGAADVIVARAGATNLAEFAVQGRACVIVPNPLLTGGHQLKNAAYLAEQHAIVVIDEHDLTKGESTALKQAICSILDNDELRRKLGDNLARFAEPAAAERLAMVLLEQVHAKQA